MELALRIRRHGNFVESVPLALILMGLAEMRGAPVYLLHGMGVVLVLARLSHAVGLSVANPSHPLRILGVLATQIAMLGAIVFLFWSLRG